MTRYSLRLLATLAVAAALVLVPSSAKADSRASAWKEFSQAYFKQNRLLAQRTDGMPVAWTFDTSKVVADGGTSVPTSGYVDPSGAFTYSDAKGRITTSCLLDGCFIVAGGKVVSANPASPASLDPEDNRAGFIGWDQGFVWDFLKKIIISSTSKTVGDVTTITLRFAEKGIAKPSTMTYVYGPTTYTQFYSRGGARKVKVGQVRPTSPRPIVAPAGVSLPVGASGS